MAENLTKISALTALEFNFSEFQTEPRNGGCLVRERMLVCLVMANSHKGFTSTKDDHDGCSALYGGWSKLFSYKL